MLPRRGEPRVLVACSGGADSLALAAAARFVAPRLGIGCGLVTVAHGLQPGSAERAGVVVSWAAAAGFDPRELSEEYVYLRITPHEVQAWREANVLEGRLLMRGGT